MKVAKAVKNYIDKAKDGDLISTDDFDFIDNKQALIVSLGRFVKKGVIKRLRPGLYYRPEKTKYGEIQPNTYAILENIVPDGYISGTDAYNRMKITYQVPNVITVVSSKFNKKCKINGIEIRFIRRAGPFEKKYTKLYQILDAVNDIKQIVETDVNSAFTRIFFLISRLSNAEKKHLCICAQKLYRPMVRALVGAILEFQVEDRDKLLRNKCELLRKGLNPLSRFNIGLDNPWFDTMNKWNIY